MIDIHCHLLYGVDDGSDSRKESLLMLDEAKRQGIHTIILTPHYRRGMFKYDKDMVLKHYHDLIPEARKRGIRLGLGCEFHVNHDIVDYLNSGRCATMAGTHKVLTEYAFETEYRYIYERTQELLFHGYEPVIAHVERYQCFQKKPELLQELSNLGAMIQVNADSILGLEGFALKRITKKILKGHLADIVASDSHGIDERACHMDKCYAYVAKKYGEEYAEDLFENNPGSIVEQEKMK